MIAANTIDNTIAYIDKLEAENKQLRAEVAHYKDWIVFRSAVVEECAKVAESELKSLLSPDAFSGTIAITVAAIRALKDKP